MSQSQKTPVSEVIGNTESFIHRVIDIRRRAAELSEQAARLQEEAYLAAVRDLGTEDGPMAFALACRGLGVDPALRSGFQVAVVAPTEQVSPVPAPPATAIVVPPAPVEAVRQVVPAVTEAPARVVAPPRAVAVERPVVSAPAMASPVVHPHSAVTSEQDDPSRLVRYGVAIKRSKLPEAEEVIDQARRTAAQNRKSNPYSDDRGRNAWRNTLFAAVLSAESGPDDDVPQADATIEVPNIDANDASVVADTEIQDSDDDQDFAETSPVEEAFPRHDGVPVGDDANAEDDVLDDADPVAEPDAHQPTLPSRAVAFTNNPVQSAPQPETRAPAPPPLSRQSNPFSRAVPAPAAAPSSVPEVHVDRPVQNRTVAHGQAVPMPKSLKDATIRKIDGDAASTPTITPPPLRRAPPFVPRS